MKKILVKVNLNTLPLMEEDVRKTCLSEIGKIAKESKGFLQEWPKDILFEHVNFVAEFSNIISAFSFGRKLLNKKYVGRVSYEHSPPEYYVIERHIQKI